MISAWSDYLQSRGAMIADGVVSHFGDAAGELAAARDGLVLADLSQFGLIALSGEDAVGFLHGQVTNELRGQPPEKAVFAGYCTAKGRLLANFLVFRRGGDLLLLLPSSLVEIIRKRLAMFVLRSKVQLRDASTEWVVLGLAGPGADELVAECLGAAPAGPLDVVHDEKSWAVRLDRTRFDLFVSPAAAPAVWRTLADRARPVGAPVWDWLTVEAGVPVILPATQDEFVPQMVNMERLHGISFQKGCYPGQEIVARSQYLGKLKRRMHLARVGAAAAPGDPLYSPDLPDQSCGTVVNAAPSPEGGSDLLAVVQGSSWEGGEVHLGAMDGPCLYFRDLPEPV